MSRWIYFILASFFFDCPCRDSSGFAKKFHGKNLVFQVEKSLSSEFLDKPQVSQGKISLTSGKLRWETTSPEKSLILFDGKILWTQQSPNSDFPGPDQVTKTRSTKKCKTCFYLRNYFSRQLKILIWSHRWKKESDQTQLTLKPKADSLNLWNPLRLQIKQKICCFEKFPILMKLK